MPYTLAMFVLWAALAAVIGGLVGWSLHAVGRRRSGSPPTSGPGSAPESGSAVSASGPSGTAAESAAEIERLRRRVAELEAAVTSDDRSAGSDSGARSSTSSVAGAASGSPGQDPVDDLAVAAEILGEPVRRDDLTLVRGLSGPVAELCGGIGVTTWNALAATPVDDLHSMLDAAGDPPEVSHLETWPRQAALLSAGEWVEFRALVDGLGPDR